MRAPLTGCRHASKSAGRVATDAYDPRPGATWPRARRGRRIEPRRARVREHPEVVARGVGLAEEDHEDVPRLAGEDPTRQVALALDRGEDLRRRGVVPAGADAQLLEVGDRVRSDGR